MKRGFTLIELLAVIIILGILAIITVISMGPVLKDSKEELTDIQINNIEEATKVYFIKHGIELTDYEYTNPRHCINIDELINSGYLDKDEINNPETSEEITGSVKITYKANNYIYEYQDNACTDYDKGIVCERVENTTLGNVPEGKFIAGDAYNCKVDPDKEPYKFYVLTTVEEDSDVVNLIMDQNIYSDGTPAGLEMFTKNDDSVKYSLVEWVSKEDYNDAVNYGESGNNNKGPITAMKFLYKATKNWVNVLPVNYIYNDKEDLSISTEGRGYKSFVSVDGIVTLVPLFGDSTIIGTQTEPLRARLPIFLTEKDKSEVYDYEDSLKNGYLYENLRTNNDAGPYAYFTLSSSANFQSSARIVYYEKRIGAQSVSINNYYGVRPVISVYKSQMK